MINTAQGAGDPHYTTFDGRYHTFNGYGEFILMEVDSDTPFTLQGRTGLLTNALVTTHEALAFGNSDLSFHVST